MQFWEFSNVFFLFLHFYNKFFVCVLRSHTHTHIIIRSHELNGKFISSICICFAFNVQQCIEASKNCPKRLSIQGVATCWRGNNMLLLYVALQWQAAAKALKRQIGDVVCLTCCCCFFIQNYISLFCCFSTKPITFANKQRPMPTAKQQSDHYHLWLRARYAVEWKILKSYTAAATTTAAVNRP